MAKAAKKFLFVRDEARDAVIEECAKVAEGVGNDEWTNIHRVIAERIRALKSVNAEER